MILWNLIPIIASITVFVENFVFQSLMIKQLSKFSEAIFSFTSILKQRRLTTAAVVSALGHFVPKYQPVMKSRRANLAE